MKRVIAVGLGAGLLFLVLDAVIHANPLALTLYAAYEPLARPEVNALLGSAIDLGYGLILAALFVRLRPSLPGRNGVVKGLAFGVGVWFLRVVMNVAGQWVTWTVGPATHIYTLTAGLLQVSAVSVFLGALLTPRQPADAA
jgi:hypothetical protein